MADETGEQLKLPEFENKKPEPVIPPEPKSKPERGFSAFKSIPEGTILRTGGVGESNSYVGVAPKGSRVYVLNSRINQEGYLVESIEFDSPPEMKGKRCKITKDLRARKYF